MDNKITKRRLSDFLAYEWILMIVISIVAIVVWELAYTIGAVRLTVGQEFKFYYDQTIMGDSSVLHDLFDDKNTFSYDVLSVSSESLTSEYNVLATRLTVQEGDILITDCKGIDDVPENPEDKPKEIRAKTMIDNYYGYSFEQMLADGQNYLLTTFMKDGSTQSVFDTYNESNLDQAKIESVFRARMKKDNRFRKESQIKDGIKLETERVKQLYKELICFEELLSHKNDSAYDGLFLKYTKYEQTFNRLDENSEDKEYWEKAVQEEKDNGRENLVYALKVEGLTKHATTEHSNPSKYFTVRGAEEATAKDVCIMAFNFRSYQPHLQYECISFINTIVRECSNIYDNVNI